MDLKTTLSYAFQGKTDAFSHLKLIFEQITISTFLYNLIVFLAFYLSNMVNDATELLD